MNFQKVLKSIYRENLPGVGSGIYNITTSSSPIPTLFKPVLDWATTIRTRMQGYDALALGLSSANSVLESIAEDQVEGPAAIPTEYSFVSEEEASAILAGFKQAREVIAPSDPLFTITTNTGLCYDCQIDNDAISCVVADYSVVPVLYYDQIQGSWMVRKVWPSNLELPSIETQVNTDCLSCVQRICNYLSVTPSGSDMLTMLNGIHDALSLPHDDTILAAVDAIAQYFEVDYSDIHDALVNLVPVTYEESVARRFVRGASESYASILSSCVDTGTINGFLLEGVEAIRSVKLSSWIQMKQNVDYSHKPCLKQILDKIALHYHQGGLKGVIYYFYSLIKAQASIRDDNGVLQFTDNAALVPKEYIAGLIGQVISSIVTVIGAIISIVSSVVGVIVSIIGSIAWALFGSLKQDYSSTRASLSEFSIDEDSVQLLPYAPFSLLQADVAVDRLTDYFMWYRNFYENTGSCAIMDVPGGALFIGPGEFQDGLLTRVRFEFHPLGQVLSRGKISDNFGGLFYLDSVSWNLALRVNDPNVIWTNWQDFLNDNPINLAVVNEADSGVLSSQDDAALFGSCAFCTWLFMCWWAIIDNQLEDIEPPQSGYFATLWPNGIGDVLIQGLIYALDEDPRSYEAKWADLITMCNKMTTMDNTYVMSLRWVDPESGPATPYLDNIILNSTPSILSDCVGHIRPASDVNVATMCNIGNPLLLPEQPTYAIIVPKFNASTFWTWIATAVAVTAVVTVTSVACAVTFNKWRKLKKAESVAKFNSAQSDYQNAISGTRSVVDPETGEIVEQSFDVNSEEGQEYIKECYKTYKKVAFKNNMLSNIIGGTRYDITTFYGEAEVDDEAGDSSSLLDSIKANEDDIMYSQDETSSENANGIAISSTSLQPVISLIKG